MSWQPGYWYSDGAASAQRDGGRNGPRTFNASVITAHIAGLFCSTAVIYFYSSRATFLT